LGVIQDFRQTDQLGTPNAIDPTHNAARVSMRPLEHVGQGKVLGHYYLTAVSGTIAASLGANSELFAARWADSGNLKVLLRLSAGLGVYTAGQTVANPLELEAIIARGWTVNYTTNATAIVPGPTAQKARSAGMGTSIYNGLGNISVCTTAGMTGGTKTLDTAGIGFATYPGNALGVADTKDLYRWNPASGEHPIILALNEGIVLRNSGAFGAAATYKLGVTIVWAEVPQF
jgi:hypothetical protein